MRLIGADRQRYVVTCNGHPIPMLATDNPDIQVGGVRYRAWQPPSALHPTITVDGPLRFLGSSTWPPRRPGRLHRYVVAPRRRSRHPRRSTPSGRVRRRPALQATGFTPAPWMSDIREKQARQSTDVGAPGILDLRRVRTVLH